MKTAVQSWVSILLFALIVAGAGCSSQDGGVTDPLPNVIPPGDITVGPDADGTMAPLTQAVAQSQAGFTVVVLPGQYSGTLVIDKPLHFLSSAGKENTIFTNDSDTTAVIVQISGSFSATDSLIFEGFGFNGAREGMIVASSTVPIAMRRCDVLDNATFGVRVGGGLDKAPVGGEISLWQCFFNRNGLSQDGSLEAVATAGLWCQGSTLRASSVFFEGNQVGLALTDGAIGSARRVGFYTNLDAGIWTESGSDLVLSGENITPALELRDGTGWGAVVKDSRLELRSYQILRNGLGGIRSMGGTIRLQDVNLDSNQRYGIWSSDSTDSLISTKILATKKVFDDSSLGIGILAESTGGDHVFRLENSEVSGSYRSGIIAGGDGLQLQLSGSLVASNGVAWVDPTTIVDPGLAIGGGLKLMQGGSASLDSDTNVQENTASYGGGVAVLDAGSSLSVNSANIHDNSVHALGAGFYIREGSVTANDLQVEQNKSAQRGGGMAVLLGGSIDAANTSIANNIGTQGSGGLDLSEGSATFTDGSVFSGNTGGSRDGGNGGAIYCNDSALDLQSVHFESNFGGYGGAIYLINLPRDLVISDCTFIQNTALSAAAIYARDLTKDFRMEYCVIAGNRLSSPSEFAPSTIYSQQDLPGGSLSFVGCTIANNSGGLAAIVHRSGLMSMTESVVAFNSPAGISGKDLQFVDMSCNDFWSNGELDYGIGAEPGPGSISEDPLFCDAANAVYTVSSNSPLLPASNDCATQIGALGQGCGITP